MFYTEFISASESHILWLRETIHSLLKIKGHLNLHRGVYQLKYAKAESLIILPKMYYNPTVICLRRKRSKVHKSLTNNLTNYADVAKLETASP